MKKLTPLILLILLITAIAIADSDWAIPNFWIKEDGQISTIYDVRIGNLTVDGDFVNITVINYNVTENISADYYFGDGSQLTGVSAGNCSVAGSCSPTVAYLDYENTVNFKSTANMTLDAYYGDGSHLTGITDFNETDRVDDLNDTKVDRAGDTMTGLLIINGTIDESQLIIKATSTQSNSNPILVLQDSSGATLTSLTTNVDSSVYMGSRAGHYAEPDATQNVIIGKDAFLYNRGGDNNFCLGYASCRGKVGYNFSNNVYIGALSGVKVTTGSINVGIGLNALTSMTTGNSNIAIGSGAMVGSTPFSASQNTFVGVGAGRLASSAWGNVGIGLRAGYDITSGTYNTMVGYFSGYNLNTGLRNTLLGDYTAQTLTSGDDNIIIGNFADVTGSNEDDELNIGNTIFGYLDEDKVGIGMWPNNEFDVNGTFAVTNQSDYVGLEVTQAGGTRIGHLEDLIGTYTGGNATLCIYDNGTLYASETPC